MANPPITVVQMLPELHSGGVERGTLELGDYLTCHGHRSIVISDGGPMVAQLENEGTKHIRLPVRKKNPMTLLSIFPLRRFLLQEKVNILHLRSRVPAWIGYLAYKSLPTAMRPRLVTTFHGFYSINAYSAIMTRGEKVIAISHTVSDHIKTHYGIPEDRIAVIHRGYDERVFSSEHVETSRLDRLREQWGLKEMPSPLIMLPGRITRWKGHDLFIRSLSTIKALTWSAVCVGAGDKNSAFLAELHGLVADCGLENRIHFVGHCADMSAAYLLADVVVSASTAEPEAFGRIAVEAQAMGKPVIATAHGGSLETVSDRETGWLVAPGNIDSMAAALAEAIERPDLREQYGHAAILWVRNRFTVEKMCRETLSLYENLLTT